MEEKLYTQVHVPKDFLPARVADKQQIGRDFSKNELAEFYKYDEPQVTNKSVIPVPKDSLLADVLRKHDNLIQAVAELS